MFQSIRGTGMTAFLAGMAWTIVVGAQSGTAAAGEASQIAILVRPPEVRKVHPVRWKPFSPALPSAIIPRLHDLRSELESGYEEIPPSFSIPADQPNFVETRPLGTPMPSHPGELESIPPLSRIPDNRVSLKEEMIALDDLDTGRVGGIVAFAEGTARGFLRIPTIWGEQLKPPDILLKPAVPGLVEGINRYSPIRTEVFHHLYLSSEAIFRMPFLFITTENAFELTPSEQRNFAEYLKNGGFVFIDNGTPQYENSAAEASLRQMVRDSLGSRAHFEPIPVSHPLYHCWFDFADGPPQGAEMMDMQSTDTRQMCGYAAQSLTMKKPVFCLDGIFMDGRMVGVFSKKGYSVKWGANRFYYSENAPQLKLGVNLVVYALTREGGMNAREMERYSEVP